MWRNIYQEFEEKLQALADEFGRSLGDFINGLRLDRALSWEALLYGFLHDWRQRGILVEEPQRQKLYKLLGELRAELVPAEELRAAMDCWKRQAADAQSRSGPLELGEPGSAEEAALPPGVRQLGHGIMRRHPPENWLHVVDDVSSSWRFAEGVVEKFNAWMVKEQRARTAVLNVQANASDAASSPLDKTDDDTEIRKDMDSVNDEQAADAKAPPAGIRWSQSLPEKPKFDGEIGFSMKVRHTLDGNGAPTGAPGTQSWQLNTVVSRWVSSIGENGENGGFSAPDTQFRFDIIDLSSKSVPVELEDTVGVGWVPKQRADRYVGFFIQAVKKELGLRPFDPVTLKPTAPRQPTGTNRRFGADRAAQVRKMAEPTLQAQVLYVFVDKRRLKAAPKEVTDAIDKMLKPTGETLDSIPSRFEFISYSGLGQWSQKFADETP